MSEIVVLLGDSALDTIRDVWFPIVVISLTFSAVFTSIILVYEAFRYLCESIAVWRLRPMLATNHRHGDPCRICGHNISFHTRKKVLECAERYSKYLYLQNKQAPK